MVLSVEDAAKFLNFCKEKKDLKRLKEFYKRIPGILNARNDNGENGLLVAANHLQPEIMRFLIEKGIDIDHARELDGYTALHIAAEKGNMPILRLLIQNRANLNKVDDNNNSALHVASSKGNLDAVKLLVSSGANLEIRSASGDIAVEVTENEEITDYLETRMKTSESMAVVSDEHYKKIRMASSWKEAVDSQTGKIYYFNTVTNQRVYEKPREVQILEDWKELVDSEGGSFSSGGIASTTSKDNIYSRVSNIHAEKAQPAPVFKGFDGSNVNPDLQLSQQPSYASRHNEREVSSFRSSVSPRDRLNARLFAMQNQLVALKAQSENWDAMRADSVLYLNDSNACLRQETDEQHDLVNDIEDLQGKIQMVQAEFEELQKTVDVARMQTEGEEGALRNKIFEAEKEYGELYKELMDIEEEKKGNAQEEASFETFREADQELAIRIATEELKNTQATSQVLMNEFEHVYVERAETIAELNKWREEVISSNAEMLTHKTAYNITETRKRITRYFWIILHLLGQLNEMSKQVESDYLDIQKLGPKVFELTTALRFQHERIKLHGIEKAASNLSPRLHDAEKAYSEAMSKLVKTMDIERQILQYFAQATSCLNPNSAQMSEEKMLEMEQFFI